MLQPGKLRTQSRALAQACQALIPLILRERRPADRLLAAYLRDHREFGSRDRRLISEMLYAAFRWWGWCQAVTPCVLHDDAAAADAQAPGATDADWSRFFLAVALLDGLDTGDAVTFWHAALPPPAPALAALGAAAREAAPGERIRRLAPLLGLGPGPFPLTALLPAWAPPHLAPPRPLDKLILWLQRRPPLWVRRQGGEADAVRTELCAAGLPPQPHPRLADALRLDNPRVNLYTVPAYSEGRIEVQDLASQGIGAVCAPRPGERWWDACAGAGGKALQLAGRMQGRGTVVATDLRAYKLEDLRRRARRAGLCNIRTHAWDGTPLPPRKATFDGVLVDAPCSCSGTWRRNPAARWTASEAEIGELQALQTRLLAAAATGVRPGGVLVYATCSLFAAENEAVADAFLAAHPAFRPEPFPHPLTGATCPAGRVQIWPWDGDCDAMFATRFRRQNA